MDIMGQSIPQLIIMLLLIAFMALILHKSYSSYLQDPDESEMPSLVLLSESEEQEVQR